MRAVGQAMLILAALWFVDRGQQMGGWWWTVAVVAGAITIPRVVADAWHEFVHEPRFGVTPVARSAFVMTTLGRLLVEGGLLALGLAFLQRFDGTRWSTVGVACAAAAIPLVSALVGPRIVLLLHRAVEVPRDHEAHVHVAALATALRLSTPRLVELDRASFEGANAYVTGQRSQLVVAVSHRLLNGPDALLRHVVGHEITHLRGRHLLWSAAAASVSIGLTTGAGVATAARLSDGNARLPLVVLIGSAASVPFRLGLAWLSRANERQADRSAMQHAPISPELLKQLHLSDQPLLEPSRLARWHSSHPAPAERLEAAGRTAAGPPTF